MGGGGTDFPEILVVEDDDDLQRLVACVFRELGYRVVAARDGWRAIERVEACPPALIVLDLVLPGIDGWQVLEYLADRRPSPPAVVITALGDRDTFTRAVREGAAAFLFKPFSLRRLIDTCERILGLHKAADLPHERRRKARRFLSLDLAAEADRERLAWAHLIDLSYGGAQIDLARPVERDRSVRFGLRIPDGYVPLALQGQVRWWCQAPQGFAHGLAFSELGAAEQDQLRDLLGPEEPPPKTA